MTKIDQRKEQGLAAKARRIKHQDITVFKPFIRTRVRLENLAFSRERLVFNLGL